MEQFFGKLILLQEGGPEQEFELNKSSITLGRAANNDIILNDTRISRAHARLECSQAGCRLVDLGASNGTLVNGVRIQKADLKPGDRISLGNAQLRFEVATPYEEPQTVLINSESDLELTMDREVLPVSIHETAVPRLVIFTQEKTWEVPLADSDSLTIGRLEGNTVVIEQTKVSRHHAEIVRRGDAFILRDLGSTNGTWYKGEPVTEMILQEGDSFEIGAAKLVFKSGFDAKQLTIADETLARMPSRRPVVFVPGLMGSQLWLGSQRVWPSVKTMFRNPEIYGYNGSDKLEARGIVDEVVIVPNLIKVDQYNRLGDYLVEDLGYERGKDFFEFAYDWRQDVRLSARQLGKLIEGIPDARAVTLIGHSLGTMVSRYYIERLGGKDRVERAILMGGPHLGAVKGLAGLISPPDILPFGLMGERFRLMAMTFPSSYQIIPTYPVGVDQTGRKIDFLQDESWVAPEHLSLLRAAREFRKELGRRSSIPALSVFGYGIKTIETVSLQVGPSGRLSNIVFNTAPAGDSGILEKSAVLVGTDIHPVKQYHGSLFVDNDVKMRLKVELARQFSA